MIFLSPAWFDNTLLGIEVSQYLGILAVVVLATVISFLLTTSIRYVIRNRAPDHRRVFWLAEFARVNRGILFLAISVIALIAVPTLSFTDDAENIIKVIARLIAAVSVVAIAFRLADIFADYLVDRAADTETKLDDQLVPLVRTVLKAFIIAIGLLFILQNLDVDITSLVAGLGLGGLAFALAAQDSIRNFISGITILADKPFQIGDWVLVGGIEGNVESIGFRSTRVRTFENSLVTIPNASITEAEVDNMGARRWRRYKTTLGIAYHTDPDRLQAFVEGIRAIILANPSMRHDYYMVEFHNFGAASLNMLLYCFIDAPSWRVELRVRHILNLDIIRLAKELQVSFAFPTQTLHLAGTPENPFEPPSDLDRDTLRNVVDNFSLQGSSGQRVDNPISDGYDNGGLDVKAGSDAPGEADGGE
jgi:MscS family membrane protein